jgi:hypothetical protein
VSYAHAGSTVSGIPAVAMVIVSGFGTACADTDIIGIAEISKANNIANANIFLFKFFPFSFIISALDFYLETDI